MMGKYVFSSHTHIVHRDVAALMLVVDSCLDYIVVIAYFFLFLHLDYKLNSGFCLTAGFATTSDEESRSGSSLM